MLQEQNASALIALIFERNLQQQNDTMQGFLDAPLQMNVMMRQQ
jgi:hypothetical protein